MANFANPEQDLYSRKLILPSGTAAEPTLIWANDPTKGFYFDVATGLIKAVGFDGGAAGAATDLSNLSSVAINAALLPNADNSLDIGSDALNWARVHTKTVRSSTSMLLTTLAGNINLTPVSGTINLNTNVNITAVDTLTTPLVHMPHGANALDIFMNNTATTFQNIRGMSFLLGDDTRSYLIQAGARQLGRFSYPTSGTSLELYDRDNGTFVQVTAGDPDSGGVGFKVLRIPN